jgi:hypothetical protein
MQHPMPCSLSTDTVVQGATGDGHAQKVSTFSSPSSPFPSVLYREEPFLCNDREMRGYTRAVSGQRLGKQYPASTDTNITIEEPCFLCGQCGNVISKDKVQLSSVWEAVKIEPERVKLKNLHC